MTTSEVFNNRYQHGCSATSAAIVVSAMAAPIVPVITAKSLLKHMSRNFTNARFNPSASYAWSK
ncbi:MAG: hypothetical protein IPL24_18505 [Bacteroidetes bacterium]|nr:hypothetical protein [Bacteroidota bacterium]